MGGCGLSFKKNEFLLDERNEIFIALFLSIHLSQIFPMYHIDSLDYFFNGISTFTDYLMTKPF